MVALLVTALIALAGLSAMGSLADSGLRWWSALGQLRRELAGDLAIQQPVHALRPAACVQAGFERCERLGSSRQIRRAA